MSNGQKDKFVWAALLHLGMNMWHDQKAPLKPVRDYLWFDEAVWRDVTQKMHDVGMNMVVIDLGEGMAFKKHPELAVKGTWSQDKMRSELDRLRGLGLEPIPKLNFSSLHDVLSHAYYGRTFNLDKVEKPRWAPPGYYVQLIRRYEGLDKAGYDQMPCATTWVPDYYALHHIKDNDVNFPLTVQHCRSVISPQRLKGFLMAPWMPTDEKNRAILLHSIDLVGQSMAI